METVKVTEIPVTFFFVTPFFTVKPNNEAPALFLIIAAVIAGLVEDL